MLTTLNVKLTNLLCPACVKTGATAREALAACGGCSNRHSTFPHLQFRRRGCLVRPALRGLLIPQPRIVAAKRLHLIPSVPRCVTQRVAASAVWPELNPTAIRHMSREVLGLKRRRLPVSHSAPLRVVWGLADGSCTPIYKLSTCLMPTMMTAGRSWSRRRSRSTRRRSRQGGLVRHGWPLCKI
jgi:hypothetical protein